MQLLRWIRFMVLLLATHFYAVQAEGKKEDVNHYRVTRSDYTFSTVFNMDSGKHSIGNVVKSIFHVATNYDSYDRFGVYKGTGICRLMSLGLFYTWATEIDWYDEHGQYKGMIDGQAASSEPAKFSFYNATGERMAIAYLDKNCANFSLVDPDNSSFILARLTRNFILDTVDNWDVVIYHPERIYPELVKIFAAFVCDTQEKFKTDL